MRIFKGIVGIIIMISMVLSCIINIRVGKLLNYLIIMLTLYRLFMFTAKYNKSEKILTANKEIKIRKRYEVVIWKSIVVVFTVKCIVNGIIYLAANNAGYIPYIIYILGMLINILNWKIYYKTYYKVIDKVFR